MSSIDVIKALKVTDNLVAGKFKDLLMILLEEFRRRPTVEKFKKIIMNILFIIL